MRMRTTSPIPKPITISLSLRVSAASGDSAPATRSRYRFLGEFKPLLGISTEPAGTISDALRARQAAVFWVVGNGEAGVGTGLYGSCRHSGLAIPHYPFFIFLRA